MKTIIFAFLFVHVQLIGQLNNQTKSELVTNYIRSNGDSASYYEKYYRGNSKAVTGHFKNHVKDSIWYFYNVDGEVINIYDFSEDKFVSTKNCLLNNIIFDNDSIEIGPCYLGGNLINYEWAMNFRYTAKAVKKKISGQLKISFMLNANKEIADVKLENSLGYGLDEEALRVFNLLPNLWIPAISNGKFVDTRIVYIVNIKVM